MTHRALYSKELLAPEWPLAFFGFLLNFVWEMWVVPSYADMDEALHWDAVWLCTQATLGDVFILLTAFWTASAIVHTRAWVLGHRTLPFVIYLGMGLAVTVVFEYLATEVWNRWAYADHAPVLPVLGTGIVPLLQWLLLPPLAISLTRRQLFGAIHMNALSGQ